MTIFVVYARLYLACLVRAARAIKKSPWTLLLPMAVSGTMLLATTFLSGLGFLSGIATTLAFSALFSSYLYFVGGLVTDARVRLAELSRSFGPYFWDIINLGFVVWVLELLLGFVLARNPQSAIVLAIVHFAEFVLLNVAPEVIYIRHTYGGMATVQTSIRFIHENWIEWFIPNLILGAAFYYGIPVLLQRGVPFVVIGLTAGALFHLVMVFRGCLFTELDASSHRQRMYKYRAQQ